MNADYDYKLSAIVLVYNSEKYLRPCLDSLVNQTLDNMEIILVNDASTDDSLSICREYEKEFSNVRIINKEENEGLSITANIGIHSANGEYVILVDNDDIIPSYAYEKLYYKAKDTDADVVTGKANLIIGDYQYEIDDYERLVWENEITINGANEFLTIFHDVFYWNKVIKRSLIIDNEIKLPSGIKVYADRKFTHTVYTYAKKISIIPDCVYLWRKRGEAFDTSLSMKRREAWNYIDRIDSFELDLDWFTSFDKNYFKILMRRVVIPITGILESEEFKKVFFERAYKILSEQARKLDDIYDNDLDILLNLYIYLILNNKRDELINLLRKDFELQRDIIFENGKNYWNLPCFRNSKIEIPDRIFEIKSLRRPFVNFENLIIEDDFITFDKIEIPKKFPIKRGEVVFTGRTTPDDILVNNKISFELKAVDGDDIHNKFTAKIPTNQLSSVEEYDITVKFEYHNGMSDKFRISKNNLKKIINRSEYLNAYLTINDKLTIRTLMINGAFRIEPKEDSLNMIVNQDISIKKPLNISVQNRKSNEIVYLTPIENSSFKIEWEYFLDKGSNYDFYINYNKKFRLNAKSILDFKDISFKTEKIDIKIYKTKNGDISLKG